ncbi:MAG: MerR family transcriptional regulator [Gammaproteobacteria bacterium]|nr:MerR family transcriptional regulator [Gammaproteobacteria bacterium]
MTSDLYRIGAVSKLTEISAERLRAWERRYDLQPAHRSGKTRFYDSGQIEHLKKIKVLLDRGQAISQLIRLTSEELDARLAVRPGRGGAARAGLVGASLILAERDQEQSRLNVLGRWASLETFEAHTDLVPALDVLIVQLPSLDPKQIERLRSIVPNTRLVCACRYGHDRDAETAAGLGVSLLRWPTPWPDVEYACLSNAAASGGDDRSELRRFSEDELLQIAMSESQVGCGCARGLVELITELDAFSVHASRCADGDSKHPGASAAEHARIRLEEALEVFVEQHQILHPRP